MKANLELIDLLRERANVSYKDAKFALEQSDYDIVEALIYLEKEEKVRPTAHERQTFRKERHKERKGNFKKFFHDISKVKFIITKNKEVILKIPLVFVAIFGLAVFPLFILLLGIAIITGHKLKIKKGDSTVKMNKVFSDIKENINNFVDTDEEEVQEDNK